MPVALALSHLVLGVKYRMVHIVGVFVCLVGVVCLLWAGIDDNKDPATTGDCSTNSSISITFVHGRIS